MAGFRFSRKNIDVMIAMEQIDIEACQNVLRRAALDGMDGPPRPEARIVGAYQTHPYFAAIHARLDVSQQRLRLLQAYEADE